jgi:hypothetical protein
MRDGKIVDGHPVGIPFEEDLAEFRRTGLGRAILEGEAEMLQEFDAQEPQVLQRLLEAGEGDGGVQD